MSKTYFIILFFISLSSLGFAGCSFVKKGDAKDYLQRLDSIPDKRELRNSFFEKRELLVVYNAIDTVLLNKYKDILGKLSKEEQTSSWRSVKINFKNTAEVSQEELKNNTVFLVGTVADNEVLKKLIKSTPFAISDSKISIGGKDFSNKNAVLSVGFYPNPLSSKRPFAFLTGTNAQQVYDLFVEKTVKNGVSFFRQSLDYEISVKGRRIAMGDFNAAWQVDDETTFFDFSKGDKILMNTDDFTFMDHHTNLLPKEKDAHVKRMIESMTAVKTYLHQESNVPKIKIHFYRNMEEKGLMTGNTQQAHIDTLENAVHIITNEIYAENHIGKENALVIDQTLGPSKIDAFTNGLPIYFTDSWQVKGYKYWAARLKESSNVLTISELLDNKLFSEQSPLIRDCLAGALVNFMIKEQGKEQFLSTYSNVKLAKTQLVKLEKEWQAYLTGLAKLFPRQKVLPKKLSYLKGFNFAHEGYNIYNGYGSTMANKSLQKQKSMGSNAMAIVPYSYIEDIHRPAPFPIINRAGNENDEAVVNSVFVAKRMGMYSLLKPQIYVSGSWPGDIEMLNKEDWEKFFKAYYSWIRHYAFLAEIHHMDALCLGVEFTKASLSHPEEWRKMIKKTRGLFSGHLTYAANWGKEFEQIEFWDDLDYIGLNSYYPLSKKDTPTDEELSAKFDAVKTKISTVYNQFKKPIVFTEIGFRSTDYPWKNPHAQADETINEMSQKRCYEVIFKGIKNEPWSKGILWWKFPSYLEYRGETNNAFTPNNKLAEETVREWFLK